MFPEAFAALLDTTRVIVLAARTDDDARACVAAGLAASHSPDLPVFEWVAGEGLVHVAGAAPSRAGPRAGSAADDPAEAVRAVQRWGQDGMLVLFGADGWTDPAAVQPLLTTQQEDANIRSWVVLVTRGGDVSRLVGGPADALTLDIRARPSAAATPAAPVRRPLDLKDIRDLNTFRSDDWSHYLDELPPTKLAEICQKRLYEPCLDRVRALALRLKKVFVDKDEVIDLMTASAVAQLPLLLLGPAGTGKSMLVRELSKGLGIAPQHRRIAAEDSLLTELAALAGSAADPLARHDRAVDILFGGYETRHFEYLVTRFTTPEELVGTVNIEVLLKFALHLRQTRGLLPRAEVVFLDEVFKANSAILNSLLSIINERLIYNAGVPWRVNLVMLFGASNEPPQDADLAAFFDRFPVRVLCRSVAGDRIRDLLKHAHAQSVLGMVPRTAKPDEVAVLDPTNQLREKRVEALSSVNDFRLLRMVCLYQFGGAELSDGSDGGDEFLGRFETAFRHLRDEYGISDRSCAHYYRLARARALLAGRDLSREDVRVLQYSGKDADDLRKLPGIVDQFI